MGQDPTLHEIITALRENSGAVVSSLDASGGQANQEPEPETYAPQCAMCRLSDRSTRRALRAFFSEFVNDPQVRARFRKSRGFCRAHTPLLARCGDALGVAILFSDLTDETRRRWRSGIWGQKSGFLSRLLTGADEFPCPCCAAAAEAEERYVQAFAQGLKSDELLWDAVKASHGLCVEHIERVGAAASHEEAGRLFQIELEKLDGLHAELEEFVRKNDYRFRTESWGPERDAWRRALDRLCKP